MAEENGLIVVESLTPEKIFKEGGSKSIIDEIKKKVAEFVPDVETDKGRKAIASLSAKVSRSKTFLDNMGKDLKAQYKAMIDPIDSERKTIRDELDKLRDDARRPLTEWEEEKKRQDELVIFNKAWDDAIAEDAIFNRERAIRLKEEALAREEEERKRLEFEKQEAERKEKERKEAEERMRKEAEEKAMREAQEAIERAEAEKKRLEKEKEEAEERAKREKIEAAERAEREKQAAIEQAHREAEEKARRAQEERERIEREKKAEEALRELKLRKEKENIEHQRSINSAALEDLTKITGDAEMSKAIISAIIRLEVRNITINY